MKKISLILIAAAMVWIVQTAQAQNADTTKNHVEIKKKVKTGAHGRQVTKIKMTGKGTPSSINGAADGAATGTLPQPATPAPVIVTPPPAPAPAPEPPAPEVIVVPAPAPDPAPAATPKTTESTTTTTTETRPVVVAHSASTHVTHVTHRSTAARRPANGYHRNYKKRPAIALATKTTTTTTIKKTE